ncbi:hypothetical protein EBR16_04730 [bacterium]|nr:hypothetical protein [bacterium]
MRTYPILPLLLAAVVSAAPSNLPAELKYDRLSVDYARGGDDRVYGVNGRALLGGCIPLRSTVGTTVTTATAKDHEGAVNLGLRYDVDAHVDVTFGYGIVSGSNIWSVSTGYNF